MNWTAWPETAVPVPGHAWAKPMKVVEDAFRKEGFSKCISGCLVNLKYVTKASKDTVWLSDITLPISRQRRNGFKEDLMRYMGGGY